MGLREKVSEVKDTAADTVSDAKTAVSDKVDQATEKVAGTRETTTDTSSGVKQTASEKVSNARDRFSSGFSTSDFDLRNLISQTAGRLQANSYMSMTYRQFSTPNLHVKSVVRQYSDQAADVAREVDYKQSYRYGKSGLKYGKRYGDYVPLVGSFVPYVGFAVGASVGVAESLDVLTAEQVANLSSSLSDATDRTVNSNSSNFSQNLATGGVAFADSYLGEPEEEDLEEILNMDYEEFVE